MANTVYYDTIDISIEFTNETAEAEFVAVRGATGPQGPQGETGATGNGIASTVLNDDYTLTITFTDGTTYTTESIRGATGVGIANVALNADYTLTVTLEDGTAFTTSSIRGETGATGEQGETGVGIASTVLNADYTLTITLTDGTAYTTPSIRGEQGATGEAGTDGVGISGVTMNSDYTLTITLTDGTSYTTTSIRGIQGETGPQGETGATGATGNGIASIVKTSTSGLVDTYTITFTDGTTTTFDVTNGEDNIQDVQINGTSILDEGVANIPTANTQTYGAMKVGSGLYHDNGKVYVESATTAKVKAGQNVYNPIVPAHQHESVFYGLAKAAGDSTQSASDNPVGTYTDDAKSSIQSMLGITDLVGDIETLLASI